MHLWDRHSIDHVPLLCGDETRSHLSVLEVGAERLSQFPFASSKSAARVRPTIPDATRTASTSVG